MFKNYLKIAWRNLTKNKLQTGINLLGLTVGTASCLCILVYVLAQTGYDTQFSDADSIYRIRTKIKHIGGSSPDTNSAAAGPPIAFAMKEDFPEIEEACRIVYMEQFESPIRIAESTESYYAERGYVADSTFFKVFDYPLLEGTAQNALDAPNAIVLSATLAKKLFGNQNALNRNIVLGAGDQAANKTVTAVFKDDFGKTHLNPNYIISMNTPGVGQFVRSVQNYATQNFVHSYVKLAPASSATNLESKLPEFLQRRGAKDLAAAGFEKTLLLQPITDIHLYSKGINNQLDIVSEIGFLYTLLILAAIILVVACINFINLRTAFANKRAKEIGVRKVVGANKSSLTYQFLGESLLLTFFATLISIPLTILLFPFINELGHGDLNLYDVLNFKIAVLLFGLALITGLLAGIYPALILAAIKPIQALKGGITEMASGGVGLRKALVVFQFVASTALIVAVVIIVQQVRYGQNKDLGYEQENLLAVRLGTSETSSRFDAIKEQFSTVSGVKNIAGANNYPSQRVFGDFGGHLPGTDPTKRTLIHYSGMSPGYINTVGMRLIAGRDFRSNDSTQTIVNKAVLESLGIPFEQALSSKIASTYEGETELYDIIGVVENYHFAPLTESIAPIALFNDNTPGWIVIRTETTDFKTLLAGLEDKWMGITKETPFEYTFVDQQVAKLFEEEQRLGKISVVFTILAILISCLGLFGLVSYVAEQKKKEIGIRKVLGASINSVLGLLTKDFIKLVGIAFLIASPMAYYFMQKWLEGFTYRIEIQWWVFALAGGFALLITLITVGFQSIKSAMANPVKSLRTE
ncbi:FtsX-like permease family protein [Maribacter algicola]|uniref:FtsX-like permease family protein n=1 Tax=Meishania litoralis TaxID=3434685 RepID=A0ACC7LLE0_9FLAO